MISRILHFHVHHGEWTISSIARRRSARGTCAVRVLMRLCLPLRLVSFLNLRRGCSRSANCTRPRYEFYRLSCPSHRDFHAASRLLNIYLANSRTDGPIRLSALALCTEYGPQRVQVRSSGHRVKGASQHTCGIRFLTHTHPPPANRNVGQVIR